MHKRVFEIGLFANSDQVSETALCGPRSAVRPASVRSVPVFPCLCLYNTNTLKQGNEKIACFWVRCKSCCLSSIVISGLSPGMFPDAVKLASGDKKMAARGT